MSRRAAPGRPRPSSTGAAKAVRPTGGAAPATAPPRVAAAAIGPARAPLGVVSRAFGRVHSELVRAISADPGDLIYGGTTGALAAVAEAARRTSDAVRRRSRGLSQRRDLGRGCAAGRRARRARRARCVRAARPSSRPRAKRLPQAYRVRDGSGHDGDPQHVSAAAADAGLARARIRRACASTGSARRSARAEGSKMRSARSVDRGVVGAPRAARAAAAWLPRRAQGAGGRRGAAPATWCTSRRPRPDAMVDLRARLRRRPGARADRRLRNRQLCLTNKAFTYILAGLPVAITDTPGQHALGVDLGRAAALVPPGDVGALAARVCALGRRSGRARLRQARRRGSAALRRWHWEHAAGARRAAARSCGEALS